MFVEIFQTEMEILQVWRWEDRLMVVGAQQAQQVQDKISHLHQAWILYTLYGTGTPII